MARAAHQNFIEFKQKRSNRRVQEYIAKDVRILINNKIFIREDAKKINFDRAKFIAKKSLINTNIHGK